MVRDPIKRTKLRSILVYIILATLPCYLLGMIVLWIGNTAKDRPTPTPTLAVTATSDIWGGQPTNTLPPIPTYPIIPTETPTITVTFTPTATYFIPSNTPTLSPTPSLTATITDTPEPSPTETETQQVTEITPAP